MNNVLERLGLKKIINAAGFMTPLGSSSVRIEVIDAVSAILPEYINMSALQARASEVIARITGAEAGCVTACTASGISMAIAACMTGENLAKIEQLPDSEGLRNEVILQGGHEVCAGGALVKTLIRIPGAHMVLAGRANETRVYQLKDAVNDKTAAFLYVYNPRVSQHLLPLEANIRIAKKYGIPIIVDAAAEYDLKGFINAGADLVIYSAHKFLSSLTAGMVAGRKDLIRACYLQESGIARPMKVGKEGIVGLIAALEAWERDDHLFIREKEQEIIDFWFKKFQGYSGVICSIEPDLTNPVNRVKLNLNPNITGITAYHLARKLREGEPVIIVRDALAKTGGFIELESCPLKDKKKDAEIVANRILEILELSKKHMDPNLMSVNYNDWTIVPLNNWPNIY